VRLGGWRCWSGLTAGGALGGPWRWWGGGRGGRRWRRRCHGGRGISGCAVCGRDMCARGRRGRGELAATWRGGGGGRGYLSDKSRGSGCGDMSWRVGARSTGTGDSSRSSMLWTLQKIGGELLVSCTKEEGVWAPAEDDSDRHASSWSSSEWDCVRRHSCVPSVQEPAAGSSSPCMRFHCRTYWASSPPVLGSRRAPPCLPVVNWPIWPPAQRQRLLQRFMWQPTTDRQSERSSAVSRSI